jgi:hypothetical protein
MHKKVHKNVFLYCYGIKQINTYLNMLLELVHFTIFIFLFLFNQTFFWYMSKMNLWVLTIVTIFEPTLIGQLSLSFLMTYI